jgi:predicted RNA binding protein YcfA (HicA-like mRNA interferase family)
MSRLPVISGKDLIRILTKHFGFRILRQKGSHVTLTNDVSFITVPLHPELDKGTLRAILNDARVGRKEFLQHL